MPVSVHDIDIASSLSLIQKARKLAVYDAIRKMERRRRLHLTREETVQRSDKGSPSTGLRPVMGKMLRVAGSRLKAVIRRRSAFSY